MWRFKLPRRSTFLLFLTLHMGMKHPTMSPNQDSTESMIVNVILPGTRSFRPQIFIVCFSAWGIFIFISQDFPNRFLMLTQTEFHLQFSQGENFSSLRNYEFGDHPPKLNQHSRMDTTSSLKGNSSLQNLKEKSDAVTANTTDLSSPPSTSSADSTKLSSILVKHVALPAQHGRNDMFRRLTRTLFPLPRTTEQMLTGAI